jgi:hydroxymethylglutaryl-CoA reductase (NADPH)
LKNPEAIAAIPMRTVGPIKIGGDVLDEELYVPLATLESPLWPSVRRGALLSRAAAQGIQVVVVDACMTRSVVLEGPDAKTILQVVHALDSHRTALEQVVADTSRFTRLRDWHVQMVGHLLYLRFEMQTGDAAGHNMVTKAADALIAWLLQRYPALQYVSISANFCTDKKVSAVNGILGRGHSVIAELLVSRDACQKHLRTTPEKIVQLHIKKNLIGTMLAGGLRSANAHFANILLAVYLATGQDAANIVEGSQGMVHAELRDSDLYFSVTLPNIIVGTVGSGKQWPFVQENLKALGCIASREPGQNAKRLAAIIAATVLCGELSLLAAQTNPGELVDSHLRLERIDHAKGKPHG